MAIGAEGRNKDGMQGVPEAGTPELHEAKAKADYLDGALHDRQGAEGIGPEHAFELDYLDEGRKRRWTGSFTTKVLSVKDRIAVGTIKARLAGGLRPDQIDTQTDNLLEIVAHLSVALVKMPDWAKDPMAINGMGVLAAIYEEVVKHEARFHGTD